jgi:hypothetical protein
VTCMSRKIKRTRALRMPLGEALKDTPWFEVDGHKQLPPGKLPKFSGALRTPIIQTLSNQPVIDGVAHIDEAINSILSQRIEKLISLLKHYQLETTKDPWLLLSLRLACAFVPGLRVLHKAPRGRGRPRGSKKWTAEARAELIGAVKTVQAERKRADHCPFNCNSKEAGPNSVGIPPRRALLRGAARARAI